MFHSACCSKRHNGNTDNVCLQSSAFEIKTLLLKMEYLSAPGTIYRIYTLNLTGSYLSVYTRCSSSRFSDKLESKFPLFFEPHFNVLIT